jgi:hypothetical protein
LSSEHAAFKSKSKDWLTQNEDNVLKWSNMYLPVSVSLHDKNQTEHVGIGQSGHHHHLIEMKLVLAMI